jgi:hypothetical protein
MSESMGDTTSSASEKPERGEKALSLTTARNMLPLVRRIIGDVLQSHHGLAELQPEQEQLEQRRRTLSWPERARRYEIQEELADLERDLQSALAEMEVLGIALLDPAAGRVGFPTLVNGKPAYFSWRPGDDGVRHWHFASENALRPIPPAWVEKESRAPSKH